MIWFILITFSWFSSVLSFLLSDFAHLLVLIAIFTFFTAEEFLLSILGWEGQGRFLCSMTKFISSSIVQQFVAKIFTSFFYLLLWFVSIIMHLLVLSKVNISSFDCRNLRNFSKIRLLQTWVLKSIILYLNLLLVNFCTLLAPLSSVIIWTWLRWENECSQLLSLDTKLSQLFDTVKNTQ